MCMYVSPIAVVCMPCSLAVMRISLLQATINIVFDRVGKTDPVTRGIEITVNYLGIQFDVRAI